MYDKAKFIKLHSADLEGSYHSIHVCSRNAENYQESAKNIHHMTFVDVEKYVQAFHVMAKIYRT